MIAGDFECLIGYAEEALLVDDEHHWVPLLGEEYFLVVELAYIASVPAVNNTILVGMGLARYTLEVHLQGLETHRLRRLVGDLADLWIHSSYIG